MTEQTYHHLILEGIKELPEDLLAEITDFVYFVRRRALQPERFEEELKRLSRSEAAHLEKEFEGYEQLYPPE